MAHHPRLGPHRVGPYPMVGFSVAGNTQTESPVVPKWASVTVLELLVAGGGTK